MVLYGYPVLLYHSLFAALLIRGVGGSFYTRRGGELCDEEEGWIEASYRDEESSRKSKNE